MSGGGLRGWGLALVAAVVLGLVALAPGPTLDEVLSSGTAWAGLLVLAGWLVRRPVQAAAAGVVVALTALVVHDGVGQLLGLFDAGVWAGDSSWFVVAAESGGPLGLLGAAGRRSDRWGLPARLAVPAGAVLEPFLLGPAGLGGVVLVVAGVVGGVTVLLDGDGAAQGSVQGSVQGWVGAATGRMLLLGMVAGTLLGAGVGVRALVDDVAGVRFFGMLVGAVVGAVAGVVTSWVSAAVVVPRLAVFAAEHPGAVAPAPVGWHLLVPVPVAVGLSWWVLQTPTVSTSPRTSLLVAVGALSASWLLTTAACVSRPVLHPVALHPSSSGTARLRP